jgi:hypothetical protein
LTRLPVRPVITAMIKKGDVDGDNRDQNGGGDGENGQKVGAAAAGFASQAIVLPRGENDVSEVAAGDNNGLRNDSKSRIYSQMGATGSEHPRRFR